MSKREPMTAARIEAIRAALGMTQLELADACGSHPRTVQRWLYAGPDPLQGRQPRGASARMLEQLEEKARLKGKLPR